MAISIKCKNYCRLAGAIFCLCAAVAVLLWWNGGRENGPPVPPDGPRAEVLLEDLGKAVAAGSWERANTLEKNLAAAGDRAVPLLDRILKEDGTPASAPVVLRQRAAWVLGEIGSPAAAAVLEAAMEKQRTTDVRGQIILALGRIGGVPGKSARAVLKKVLASPNEAAELRSSAALLLAKRPEPEATALLVEFVRRRPGPEPVKWAVDALGFSAHRQAASPLLRALVRGEEDERLRAAALRSLARLEGSGSLAVLGEYLQTEKSAALRREIVSALGEMEPAPGAPALLEKALAGDKDRGVRALAAAALARPGNTASIPALKEALAKEKMLYVRLKVVEALGKVGGKEALVILRNVSDSDPFIPVRNAARAALKKLGEKPTKEEPLKTF